jgi:hypothetical protein
MIQKTVAYKLSDNTCIEDPVQAYRQQMIIMAGTLANVSAGARSPSPNAFKKLTGIVKKWLEEAEGLQEQMDKETESVKTGLKGAN